MGDDRPRASGSDVDDVRGVLVAEQRDVLARIDGLERSFGDIVAASESANADDEHDPEGATIAFERAQVAALLLQARTHLTELAEALARLDAGTFGRCEQCGNDIAVERLLARPTAQRCVPCAGGARR